VTLGSELCAKAYTSDMGLILNEISNGGEKLPDNMSIREDTISVFKVLCSSLKKLEKVSSSKQMNTRVGIGFALVEVGVFLQRIEMLRNALHFFTDALNVYKLNCLAEDSYNVIRALLHIGPSTMQNIVLVPRESWHVSYSRMYLS